MIFETTDGKIGKLDKKIKRMESTIKMLQDSFETITEIIKKMQDQNESLKKNYQTLDKTKDKMKEINSKQIDARKLLKAPLNPIKEKFKENVDFIREIATEGLEQEDSVIVNENLYFKSPKMMKEDDIISFLKNGSISSDELAHKLHVHKAQVEVWASKLQKKNIIDVKNSGNKVFIVLKRTKT